MVVKEQGSYTVKGTVRKINEDRFNVQVGPDISWVILALYSATCTLCLMQASLLTC